MGLARSGQAAALLCKQLGAEVTISEQKPLPELKMNLQNLKAPGITLELGGHIRKTFLESDYIIISPGVPGNHRLLEEARRSGIPVLGEVELAYQYSPCPLIAITGTKGKGTTCALLGEMLRHQGIPALVGGNIGKPLAECVMEAVGATHELPLHYIVAEISSFQLETIHSFRPKIAALLNLTPDHLDRHASLEEYTEAKKGIFKFQEAEDMAVINADDTLCLELSRNISAQKFYFSMKASLTEGQGIYWDKSRGLARHAPTGETIFAKENLQLRGNHNIENALAAALCARLAGAGALAIQKGLKNFQGLPHCLELVAEINGVKYINNSKATNVVAAIKSIEAFEEPIILIAGGKDKGGNFTPLAAAIKKKVKHVVLMGEDRNKIKQTLNNYQAVEEAPSLEAAVIMAQGRAARGDVVLLSPACASFDMFRNSEERGEIFRRAVKKLAESKS